MLNFIWFCPSQNNLEYVNQANRNLPILIASPYIPLKQKVKHPYQFLDFALSRLSAKIFIHSLFESSRKPDTLVVNTISAMVLLSNCNFPGQYSIATKLYPQIEESNQVCIFPLSDSFNCQYEIVKNELQAHCFPTLAPNRRFLWLNVSQIGLKFLN